VKSIYIFSFYSAEQQPSASSQAASNKRAEASQCN